MEFDFSYYKALSEAFSPSGLENEVRDLIEGRVRPYVDTLRVDRIGNLIATKGNPSKLLICAHMDEVGLMVVSATEDGLLRVAAIGGVDSRVLVSKRVKVGYGESQLDGVIGAMADKVLVMKNGEMVEYGDTEQVLNDPKEAYTRTLMSAVPRLKR